MKVSSLACNLPTTSSFFPLPVDDIVDMVDDGVDMVGGGWEGVLTYNFNINY